MDKLWAPWRVKYVTGILDKEHDDLFSRIAKDKNDKKNLVFVRTKYSYAVLNLYPYNNGHSLIVPYRQVPDLSKLPKEETADLFELLNYTKELLDEVLKPGGYNIGMNIGRVAGAGVPNHLHIHIVPRWKGDVNFMPVIGSTKVVSQSLATLYEKLYKAHQRRCGKKISKKKMKS